MSTNTPSSVPLCGCNCSSRLQDIGNKNLHYRPVGHYRFRQEGLKKAESVLSRRDMLKLATAVGGAGSISMIAGCQGDSVTGTYVFEGSTLVIKADGTFSYSSEYGADSLAFEGTWKTKAEGDYDYIIFSRAVSACTKYRIGNNRLIATTSFFGNYFTYVKK